MPAFVYILASSPHGAIYVGSTVDLSNRIEQHKAKATLAHTRKYHITKLVWYEYHDDLSSAQLRERQIKRWRRQWKDTLIAEMNGEWRDISDQIL